MTNQAVQYYQNELNSFQSQWNEVSVRCRFGSMARGLCFLISAALFFYAYFQAGQGTVAHWGTFGVSVFVFLCVVIVHNIYEKKEAFLKIRVEFFQQGIARIARDWDKIDSDKNWLTDGKADAASLLVQAHDEPDRSDNQLILPQINDLDLEGEKSLWRLIGLCQTEMGKETLNRWMLEPANQKEIQSRQDAVSSIKDQDKWRHDLLLLVRELNAKNSDPASVVRWSLQDERPKWLGPLVWFARLTTLTLLASFGLFLGGALTGPQVGLVTFVIVLVHFLISVCTAGFAGELFRQIGNTAAEVSAYRNMMELVTNCPSETVFIQERKKELCGETVENPEFLIGMKSLIGISLGTSIRRGVFFPLYVVLQFGFLWDIHLVDVLWRWKLKWGNSVPKWFSAAGKVEAIASLSQTAYEHVDWTFPKITSPKDESPEVIGTKVGHPLLGNEGVANPMEIGPSDRTVLVTGSNMSGKSTYLRALGVNLVLGRMGCSVAASSFEMPPASIGTSMRVSDSLSDGISFFMSELKRLKQIVDAAKSCNDDIQFVYLLDEILQGTNSAERQIAVAKVVTQLQKASAIGALSTHDLQLPEVPELADHLKVVHFKESFEEKDGKKTMTFDYHLRPGLSPSTNALKLLALVGLDD